MGVFNEAGLLLIGTRLKRLSDRFLNEVSRIYKSQNIRFEPAWFPVFFLLDKKGSLSLTEIATELEVSHSAISQMITQLLNKKMVEIQPDNNDARIKKIVFSAKGKKMIEQVQPIWQALHKSLLQLIPADTSDFLSTVAQMEEKLSNGFLYETTLAYIHDSSPEIVITEPDDIMKKKFISWVKSEDINFTSTSEKLVIAVHGKSFSGFVAYDLEAEIKLRNIYVTSFYRRKGIATQMLQYIKTQNPENCFFIEDANIDLIKVFIKAGFSFKVK